MRAAVLALAGAVALAAPAMARADSSQTVNGVQVESGGVVVNGDAIVYLGGAVIVDTDLGHADPGLASFGVDVTAQAIHGCVSGYLCLYAQSNYGGDLATINICCTWLDLSDYGFNNTTASYVNRSGSDVRMAKQADGGGDILCVPAGDQAATMPSGWANKVSSIRILANGGCA